MTVIRSPHRLALAGVAIAMMATFVVPTAAFAAPPVILRRHAKLLNSGPAANDTLRAAPKAIKLWFSEPVEISISRIKLIGAGGTIFATGKTTHIPGESEATLLAPVTAPLAAGTYTVRWMVASDDGHLMKGSYSFFVVPRMQLHD
jgi:methionine-rich copper-binding protein CopC